jgi:hypothetical protein
VTFSEVAIYLQGRKVVDWTPREIKAAPVLRKLRAAKNQDQLPEILKRVGETGDREFQDFPRIACNEAVTSQVGGRYATVSHHRYRYIVLPHSSNGVSWMEEYRTDLNGSPASGFNLDKMHMLTVGFSSDWLYLSAADQNDSRYRYFGTQVLHKRLCHVVAFAQDPLRARRFKQFEVYGDQPALLLLQGLAWVDVETFQILRVMTWLLAPRPDLRLTAQISIVDFYPVQPVGMDRAIWAPRDVNVWVVYNDVGIRNIHQYSNFQLFRVESTIKP